MSKNIFLKRIKIVNFKGLRLLDISFEGHETLVKGENGTGKTTIQDAFLWCLFGKDHNGRSDFSIKTLDGNHNPILHVDHEVSVALYVDDEMVVLKRCYREKWGVGENEGKLMSHFTEYYKNDVKLDTKKAYDSEVSDIIPEDVFRMITSPKYFASLSDDDKKKILTDMVGEVSDEEISEGNPDFLELIGIIKGNSLTRFKKELASKKNAITDELKSIPSRIDEVNRSIPESENWEDLASTIRNIQGQISDIDKRQYDMSQKIKSEYMRKAGIQKEIGEKKIRRTQIESTVRFKATNSANKAASAIRDIDYKINNLDDIIKSRNQDICNIRKSVDDTNSLLDKLRKQYREISNTRIEFSEEAFVCPTCKRPLDPDDIESKQAEMLSNFNIDKASKLKANREEGMSRKRRIEELQAKEENFKSEISSCESEKANLIQEKEEISKNTPVIQNPEELIANDPEWIRLGNEISELENQLSMTTGAVEEGHYEEEKKNLTEKLDEAKLRYSKKDIINRSNTRISELENQLTSCNQSLADIEKQEYLIKDFQKAKDSELLNRINGMFKLVSFTFTAYQLNGNDKITCTMWVNGAPYQDANSAGQINAGLDVINAICSKNGITAPIFVDNRESVNELIGTYSQIINLQVSNDQKLVISNV